MNPCKEIISVRYSELKSVFNHFLLLQLTCHLDMTITPGRLANLL